MSVPFTIQEPCVVEKLNTDGRGIVRMPNMPVIFVKNALPQEKVIVTVTQTHKKYYEGYAEEILEASPLRVPPRCSVFGICGGCQLQHLKDSEHINVKKEWLKETLRRIGKWPQESIECVKIGAEVPIWNYRQRVRVRYEDGILGFCEAKSHKLVSADTCAIMLPKLKKIVEKINDWIQKEEQWNGYLLEFEVTVGKDGFFSIRISEGEEEELWNEKIAKKFDKISNEEIVFDSGYVIHPTSFVQPHYQAMKVLSKSLAQSVEKFLIQYKEQKKDKIHKAKLKIWDLYAGSGAFTNVPQSVAERLGFTNIETLGVEGVTTVTAAFHKNAPKARFLAEDVHVFLEEFFDREETTLPDILVLDPPREGLGLEHTDLLAASLMRAAKPCLVCYIACDPASLARDGACFFEYGFNLQKIEFFDLFGQTLHYETLAAWEYWP